MVQRLVQCLIIVVIGVATTSCATTTVTSEYCHVTAAQLPILLSRKDSPGTKKSVAEVNETHQRLCRKK
jgi:hypothetical protein